MWPAIRRARRRPRDGGAAARPGTAASGQPTPALARRGRGHRARPGRGRPPAASRSRRVLGDAVDRPDTPARLERALAALLAGSRRARPAPRPAPPGRAVRAGELGDPPRRRRAGHRCGRPGRRPVRGASRHDRGRLPAMRDAVRPGPRHVLPPLRAAVRPAAAARPPSCRPARSATGPSTTTDGCRAWSEPACASTSSTTRPSTSATRSATTTGWSRCAAATGSGSVAGRRRSRPSGATW